MRRTLVLVLALLGFVVCGKPTADTTPPVLDATLPVGGAMQVALDTTISVHFSEPMEPTSVGLVAVPAVTFGAPVASEENQRFVFTPTAPLRANTSYRIAVTGKDVAGNALSGITSFTFVTVDAADTVAPTIVSFEPSGTAVAPGAALRVTFSEPMNPASVAVTLSPSHDVGAPSFDAANTVATFTPAAPLAELTAYTVSVSGTDVAGNALAGATTFSFTTATAVDTVPPTIVAFSPSGTDVAQGAVLRITFSEAMARASVGVTLAPAQAVGAPVFEAGDTVATFTPTAPLAAMTAYTATVAGTDVAGNALAGVTTFSFTTRPGGVAPTVLSMTPDGGAPVPPSTVITVTFSTPMNQAATSAAFSLHPVATPSAPVAGNLTFDPAGEVLTFTPAADLTLATEYEVTIGTGATDMSGVPLAAPFQSRFRTVQPSNPGDSCPCYGNGLHCGGAFCCAGAPSVACCRIPSDCPDIHTSCAGGGGDAGTTFQCLPSCARYTVFTVQGGGAFCSGGAGVPVTLSGSQTGVQYQLRRDGIDVGARVTGTGAALSFGNQTQTGTYTVAAVNTAASCAAPMSGQVVVAVNNAPTALTGTASATTVCTGSSVTFQLQGQTGGSCSGGAWEYEWRTTQGTVVRPWLNSAAYTRSVTSNLSYVVHARCSLCPSLVSPASNTVSVTAATASTAPTGVTATLTTTCGSTSMTVSGGALGTGAGWHWYSGSCGGTYLGPGATLGVTPSATTTYYVRAEGGVCNVTTACAGLTITKRTCAGTCSSCNAGTGACQADTAACTGNCDVCTGSGDNFNCAANASVCTGTCAACTQASPTAWNCAANEAACPGSCSTCSGSGTNFNCVTSGCAPGDCRPCTGGHQMCTSSCTWGNCVAGPCP
ncbi:MAG: Ig-like domain-containing protein [Myxococcota bacterium]